MITFIEYSQKVLKFLAIVLRVIRPGTPSIRSLSKHLPSLVQFSFEDVFCVDKLRKKYPKEAAVFTLDVNSSIFLRNHNEVNLRAARQYIAKALESMLGDYRDYNGGFLNKENEQLQAIQEALKRKKMSATPLMEDLFYNIKPITMRALILAQTGVEIAVLLRKLLERSFESEGKYLLESLRTEEADIVIIKTDEKEWRASFPQNILSHSPQTASSCVEYEGFLYICFFQQYPEHHHLLEVVQKELNQRQSLLVDNSRSILRLNLQGGDPPSLNPRLAMDIQCHILCDLLFEGLTRINRLGNPELAAAEKVEISPDGILYTFHLRRSCWSNGEEVTAYHFERAWKKAISDHLGFTRIDLFSPIKNAKKARQKIVSLDRVGIVAKDTKTLCVELESPCSYFLNLVAAPSFFPLYGDSEEPSHFNGPFILAEWKHDCWIYLSQNPFYWNVQRIKLTGIKISMVRDPYAAYKMFQDGELDLIGDPISPLPPEILKNKEVQDHLLYKYVSRVFWIHCNTHVYPLHNTHLRRALSVGLNRKRLTEKVFIEQMPHLSPLPPKYSHVQGNIEGDPEEARFHFKMALEELKIDPEHFPQLTITHSKLSFEKALVAELKAQWKEILGINVLSQELTWSEFSAALDKGDFQLGGLFRRDLLSHAMSYLSFFNQSPSSLFTWDNEEFGRLLNNPDRGEHLKKIEHLLMQETPVIPLVNQRYLVLIHDRIKGLDWIDNGCLDLTKVWINDKNSEHSAPPVLSNVSHKITIRRKQYAKEKINA